MNVPKAIELAIAEIIREYAEIGEGVTIRVWQSLASDGSWAENPDRTFPMIDVRCSPPLTDDNQSTRSVECAILMGTNTDDDKDHAFISAMYEAVQEVMDDLFAVFRSGTLTTEPFNTFQARVVTEVGATPFSFGGLTFGEGLAPADDGGINMIGITIVVHYSRSDF